MNIGGMHDIPQDAFINLAEDMGQSTHPLVLFAAGSATVEAAHYSQRASRPPRSSDFLQARLDQLERADHYYTLARHGFAEQQDEATDDKMRAEWFALEVRALQALAAKPSLQILTHWACGHEVAPAIVQEATTVSMRQTLALGGVLMAQPTPDLYMRRVKNGSVSELEVSLLLQWGSRITTLVVPTSLRQDHHRKSEYRADLLAIGNMPLHPRTLIQVDTGSNKTHRTIRAMHVKTKEDLVFDVKKPGKTVLHALLEADSGSSVVVERLDELSHKLIKRLINKRRSQ